MLTCKFANLSCFCQNLVTKMAFLNLAFVISFKLKTFSLEMFQCNACDLKCINSSVFFRHINNEHQGLEGLVPDNVLAGKVSSGKVLSGKVSAEKVLSGKKRLSQNPESFKCHVCDHTSKRYVCKSIIGNDFHISNL